MARLRKRQLQQALFDRDGRPLGPGGKPTGRGGKREGAGRKPKGRRAGAPHTKRPELNGRYPVHIVLRVVDAVGNLRRRHTYKALRAATIAVAKREVHDLRDGAFRIVHLSIQRNHVHLLVEAGNKLALSRGMQSFQISAAKQLNRAISIKNMALSGAECGSSLRTRIGSLRTRIAMANRRRGTVFPDRFHEEILTSPRQCRNALAYVLNNWRKHREDREGVPRTWKVDPFSTGVHFDGWKERADAELYMPYRDTYQPMFVFLPKSWLLREGWRIHGLISFWQVPSAQPMQRKQAGVR